MEFINFSRLAREAKILSIIFFGFLIRLSFALYNSFISTSIIAKDDAIRFHNSAVIKSQSFSTIFTNYTDGWIYSSFIAFFYYIFTPSLFIASLLNCFIWFCSALVLNETFKLLEINECNKKIGFILYSLAPTSIIYTSVPLRESLQLFFVNLFIYSVIKILFKKKNIYFLYILIINICLISLHKIYNFLFIFIIILLVTCMIKFLIKKNFNFDYFFLVIISFAIILFNTYEISYLVKVVFQPIENFLKNMPDSRTTYFVMTKIENHFHFIINSFLFYNLKPFPNDIYNFFDLIYFSENILRFFLILLCFYNFLNCKNSNSTIIIFFIFLVLELLWSFGTSNWGSASRHHVGTFGLLIFLVIKNNFFTQNIYK